MGHVAVAVAGNSKLVDSVVVGRRIVRSVRNRSSRSSHGCPWQFRSRRVLAGSEPTAADQREQDSGWNSVGEFGGCRERRCHCGSSARSEPSAARYCQQAAGRESPIKSPKSRDRRIEFRWKGCSPHQTGCGKCRSFANRGENHDQYWRKWCPDLGARERVWFSACENRGGFRPAGDVCTEIHFRSDDVLHSDGGCEFRLAACFRSNSDPCSGGDHLADKRVGFDDKFPRTCSLYPADVLRSDLSVAYGYSFGPDRPHNSTDRPHADVFQSRYNHHHSADGHDPSFKLWFPALHFCPRSLSCRAGSTTQRGVGYQLGTDQPARYQHKRQWSK